MPFPLGARSSLLRLGYFVLGFCGDSWVQLFSMNKPMSSKQGGDVLGCMFSVFRCILGDCTTKPGQSLVMVSRHLVLDVEVRFRWFRSRDRGSRSEFRAQDCRT